MPAGPAHDPRGVGCFCSSSTRWSPWPTYPGHLCRPKIFFLKEDIGYEIVVLYDGEQHLARLLQPQEDLRYIFVLPHIRMAQELVLRVSRACLPRWTTTVRRCPMCAFTQRARAAGMAQSDFGRALAGAERRMERAAVELARTRACWNGRIWRARSVLPLPSPRRWRSWPCSRGCFRPIRASEGSGIDGTDAVGHRAH